MPTPQHIVAAAGYIVNQRGRVLLVRTFHRKDTWEMPGGQVEEGESVEQAVRREVLEESGVICVTTGITGLYQNRRTGVIVVVFAGMMTSGVLATSGETSDVRFVDPSPESLRKFITRPQFLARTLHAGVGNTVPFEALWPDAARFRPEN